MLARSALRLPVPNRRRPALGGTEKFLLPPREQDVAQRCTVVDSVDEQAKTVEHRGLLVGEFDRDVFERDRSIDELGDIGGAG
jgi:hypothetical protein